MVSASHDQESEGRSCRAQVEVVDVDDIDTKLSVSEHREPDKLDIAGAFRRMEIRTFLRDMKADEQTKYFANHGDSLPTEVAMAIMELPPEFSGVPKSRHDLMTTKALEAQHGPEIVEIA